MGKTVLESRIILENQRAATCWVSDRKLRSSSELAGGLTAKYIPDGIYLSEGQMKVAIEIEISVKSKTRYREKIKKYVHLMRGQGVQHNFGEFLKETDNGLNLFEVVNQEKIVFIFLDSRRYKASAQAIGRLIVQDLISTSARIDAEIPKHLRKPFTAIIDEGDSADAIASRAGTKTVWKTTERTTRMLFWDMPTGDKSLRQTEEFNNHPNVIKSLGAGECVAIKKYPRAVAYKVRVYPER